jgi:hypothetical protein
VQLVDVNLQTTKMIECAKQYRRQKILRANVNCEPFIKR